MVWYHCCVRTRKKKKNRSNTDQVTSYEKSALPRRLVKTKLLHPRVKVEASRRWMSEDLSSLLPKAVYKKQFFNKANGWQTEALGDQFLTLIGSWYDRRCHNIDRVSLEILTSKLTSHLFNRQIPLMLKTCASVCLCRHLWNRSDPVWSHLCPIQCYRDAGGSLVSCRNISRTL